MNASFKFDPPPEQSEWSCQLFGSGPGGMVWRPAKGRHPNAFQRWMCRVFFASVWVKDK